MLQKEKAEFSFLNRGSFLLSFCSSSTASGVHAQQRSVLKKLNGGMAGIDSWVPAKLIHDLLFQ